MSLGKASLLVNMQYFSPVGVRPVEPISHRSDDRVTKEDKAECEGHNFVHCVCRHK